MSEAAGHHREPSAGIIDSQTVKTAEQGGIRGYDGGKRLRGRKRHVVVDVLGLLLVVMVQPARIQDRDDAKSVLAAMVSIFPKLQLIWTDGGYAGKRVTWVTPVLQRTLEIVNRPGIPLDSESYPGARSWSARLAGSTAHADRAKTLKLYPRLLRHGYALP